MENGWKLLEHAVRSVSRTYVWGPPGTGKSHFALMALRENNRKSDVAQVTLNEDTVVQELLGHYVPKESEFAWHDGPVTKSFRFGGGLVVNELSRGTGAVKDMFLSILDDPEIALLSLPNNENLRRGDGFRVVVTANTPPDDLDEALQDRFDAIVKVTEPNPELIRHLNALMKGIGNVVLDSYKDDARAISPRRIMAFAKFIESGVNHKESAMLAFSERHNDIVNILVTSGVLKARKV